MLRPIRPMTVAPLSQVRDVPQGVPLTVGGVTQAYPIATVQELAQQRARLAPPERPAKAISNRVSGLLGGQTDIGGLLSQSQGDAALQGLFSTLQAMGRPVRRGEDRYLGAVQYGQQQMDAARKRGLEDLSTRMQLEKYAREKQLADARREALADMTGPASADLGQVFTEYELTQMSGAQKSLASQSEAMRQKGLQLMSLDPSSQVGKELLDQAEKLRSNALTGIRTRTDQAQEEKTLRTELAPSLKQANEVASKHNSLINLTDQAMKGSFVSGYGAVVQALKSLEPNSAVLSSEYDSATSLAGVLSQAIQLFEGARGRMTPEMAQSLRDVASAAAQTSMEVRSSIEEQYAPIVSENFLRPDQVFLKPIPLRQAPQVYDFSGAAAEEDRKDAERTTADEIISEFGSGA